MNLYIISFANGWKSAQIAVDKYHAMELACECYTCWFENDATVTDCKLLIENI